MRNRARVHLAGLPRCLMPDRPLLIAANHVSWWDGFVLRELQRWLRPGAPFNILMTGRELERFSFLEHFGAIGIDAGSPASIVRAIRCLEARMRDRPDSVLVYFPQGEIQPTFRRPLGFRRGVEVFARRIDAIVLPVGIHVEPLNRVAASCFALAGEVIDNPLDVARLETAVEMQLDTILGHIARHGERAARCWPELHERPMESAGDTIEVL